MLRIATGMPAMRLRGAMPPGWRGRPREQIV